MLVIMKIALLKMGATMPSVAEKFGDYESWFNQSLDLDTTLMVVDAHADEPLPTIDDIDGLIISGSAFSVYDREPWSQRAAQWLRPIIESKTPILGVCYGHQLLAQESGAMVALNPAGREIGVCTIKRIKDDPLFDGLDDEFDVVQTHSDAVMSPVSGATILASNDNTNNQAMAIGPHVRTVQWHPEMTHEIIREYIELRRQAITDEFGASHVTELLKRLRPTTSGAVILSNFVKYFVKRSI